MKIKFFIGLGFALSALNVISSSIIQSEANVADDEAPSQFEQLCCNASNRGKSILVDKQLETVEIIFCPYYFPAVCYSSCSDILSKNPDALSGYYDISLPNVRGVQKTERVYCHMEELCGSEGGWTRIASLDMSNSTVECPSPFRLYESSGIRSCGRPHNGAQGSCYSHIFSTKNVKYSQICGRVKGYQWGTTDAIDDRFEPEHRASLDSFYIDGISITRGSPRKHIWSFISAAFENYLTAGNVADCPCAVSSSKQTQSFIGNDYYCESGNPSNTVVSIPYFSDPLWDGRQCGAAEGPCCQPPSLPWFHKVLTNSTTDFIELRVCTDQKTDDEDVTFSEYEFYIKI